MGVPERRTPIARHDQVSTSSWPPAFSPAYVESALRLLERRGVLLVVGAPGSNRHRLGRAVAESDGHVGTVHQLICRHDDAETGLSTLHRLLGDLDGASSVAPGEAADALRDLLRGEDGTIPTLLLDGAGFCDQQSIDAFADLAADGHIRIVFAATPETVSSTPRLAAMAERIDIEPLDRATIARLLRARFGDEPHDLLVAFAAERSQGAYGSLCDIGDTLVEADALVRAEGVVTIDADRLETARLSLPHRRRPLSAERLGGRAETVALIDLVAMIGEVEAAEAAHCVDAAEITLAVRHGALRDRDGVLSLVDSLEAEAVVAAMPVTRMTELWHTYAHLLDASIHRPDSVIRTVRWCSVSGATVDPELARLAAREANHRGLYRRTVSFTAPGATSADPHVTQQERAHALTQVGDVAGLAALLARLDPSLVPEDELMHFMRWTTRVVPESDRPGLRRLAIGADVDDDTRRRRTAAVDLADLYARGFAETSPDMIRTVRTMTLSGILSPTNEAIAQSVLCVLLRHAGRPAEAVHAGRAALRAMESDGVDASSALLDPVREIQFMALLSTFELAEAADLLTRYQAKGARYGVGGRLGLLMAALLELTHGRSAAALAHAQLFLTRPTQRDAMAFRGWVQAVAAQALVTLERHEEAADMLAQSEAQPGHLRRQNDLERRLAQATVHDAIADPERALEILMAVADEARAHGLRHAEQDALGLALLVDGPRMGPRLLAAVEDVDSPTGAPAVWQALARAVVAYDFGALLELAEGLVDSHELFAARVAQFTLDAGRRSADLSPEARETLTRLTRLGRYPGL